MRFVACMCLLFFAATAQSDCWGAAPEVAVCDCGLTGVCTCGPECQCPECEEWQVRDGVHYLMRHGVQVGGWNGTVYRNYDPKTATWSEPVKGAHPQPPRPNYGVDLSKVSRTESCAVNGKKCSKTDVIAAMASVPDDAKKLRCTIIGSEAARKQVRADLDKLPEAATLVIQDYAPDHWAVKGLGFAPGSPAIYLQKPDGTVVHRQDDYSGPEDLQGAIRKANESYDSKIDIDLRRNSPQQSALPTWVWWVGGGVLVLFLLKRKS